jgi:hypothetical protein
MEPYIMTGSDEVGVPVSGLAGVVPEAGGVDVELKGALCKVPPGTALRASVPGAVFEWVDDAPVADFAEFCG